MGDPVTPPDPEWQPLDLEHAATSEPSRASTLLALASGWVPFGLLAHAWRTIDQPTPATTYPAILLVLGLVTATAILRVALHACEPGTIRRIFAPASFMGLLLFIPISSYLTLSYALSDNFSPIFNVFWWFAIGFLILDLILLVMVTCRHGKTLHNVALAKAAFVCLLVLPILLYLLFTLPQQQHLAEIAHRSTPGPWLMVFLLLVVLLIMARRRNN